jgi:hypothetical protein
MCRPSCCNNTRGQGTTGIAAAAVIGTAMIAVKTGPVVVRILHDVVEVLTIVALTALTALALVIVACLIVRLVWWRLRQRAAQQRARRTFIPVTGEVAPAAEQAHCLACGGNGRVLQPARDCSYELRAARNASLHSWRGDHDARFVGP